jgi:hypothetical protein
MTWRDKLRDLSILYSLADDLKLFWQFKAMRWEKLEATVRHTEELKVNSLVVDEEVLAERLKQLLLADQDYREVRHRIRVQLKEVRAIMDFLKIGMPEALEALTFKPPLMDNAVIEVAVEATEGLEPAVRAAPYGRRYVRQVLTAPRQFFSDLWSFYF